MNRRGFIATSLWSFAAFIGFAREKVFAKTYLTVDQAKNILWEGATLTPKNVELTPDQMKAIRTASKTRVRSSKINAWVTENKDWFIVDQVIGKHENIDLAVALTNEGKVKGLEILTYRESYGYEIMDPKWRAQFHGRGAEKVLKLDKDIQNIGGATLSCRHVTDGINRLVYTWDLVLKHL